MDHFEPADGGKSPNAYRPFISVQIRVHWPPRATVREVMVAMGRAVGKAAAELKRDRELWEADAPDYRYHWFD